MLCLDLLANEAYSDELDNIFIHSWPPEIFLQIVVYLHLPWVTRVRSPMSFVENFLLDF